LVVSDVAGKFDQSYKFVDTIAASHGAFTMMICVGKFFGGSDKEIEPYISGQKTGAISQLAVSEKAPKKKSADPLIRLCSFHTDVFYYYFG
jgi:hypothetical protein